MSCLVATLISASSRHMWLRSVMSLAWTTLTNRSKLQRHVLHDQRGTLKHEGHARQSCRFGASHCQACDIQSSSPAKSRDARQDSWTVFNEGRYRSRFKACCLRHAE